MERQSLLKWGPGAEQTAIGMEGSAGATLHLRQEQGKVTVHGDIGAPRTVIIARGPPG